MQGQTHRRNQDSLTPKGTHSLCSYGDTFALLKHAYDVAGRCLAATLLLNVSRGNSCERSSALATDTASYRRQVLQLVALQPLQLPELDEEPPSLPENLLAKVDISRRTLSEPHFGHTAWSALLIVVKSSKRFSQDWHLYSYIGIGQLSSVAFLRLSTSRHCWM